MLHRSDNRVVLTLDAGGTKFSFSAMARGEIIADPLELPAEAKNLERCLKTIVEGFAEMRQSAGGKIDAISFAFPGPSYYEEGIIGDLGNLPAFRGGIPLGALLSEKFAVPVFINNDGDLFALGEALGGFLPQLNHELEIAGSTKRYRNLIGLTLGTGFGGGIVHNGRLFSGDNSAAGEVWLLRNPKYPHTFAEESLSIRALQRVYRAAAGDPRELSAKQISLIAREAEPGESGAARAAFAELGSVLGECIANIVTIIDAPVVIGGGLSNSYDLFAPAMMQALDNNFTRFDETSRVARLEMAVFNVEDATQREKFLRGQMKEAILPASSTRVRYDAMKRSGIGVSRLGTSRAAALGAYVFALEKLGNPA